MRHVVLLGDSTLDNGSYTGGSPDVLATLLPLLPSGWRATLLAVDRERTDDVARQLRRLPPDASHLVLSVGGNDALSHSDILERRVRSVGEALTLLADAAQDFEQRYRRLLEFLRRTRLPLFVCTIYNGNFPDAGFQRIAATALTVFNDAIVRVALEHQLRIIDLRQVCSEPADYTNAIEPSASGGAKIARAIASAIAQAGARSPNVAGS